MLSEDVQDLNATELDMYKHLYEARELYYLILKFYSVEDPSYAFDLQGDPPAWLIEVTRVLQARGDIA